MTHRRRAVAAALAVAAAVAVPSALVPAASQAAAYRYWSYWLGTDAGWSFANVGPAYRSPADGSIEGWRFSVSGVEGNHTPSFAADFEAVCGNTDAVDGRKRVAVVVDPGSSADAPDGEQPPGAWAMCIVAEPRATGYDVLRAAATVRTDRGLICAIGGYPARGCADVIAEPTPTPTTSPKPSPKPSRSPEPTRSPAPTASGSAQPASTPTAAPASAGASATATAASASPTSPRTSALPPPEPSATPTDTTASPDMAAAPPTPEPTYSLLTTPLADPPSDSGSGGAIIAGIAVMGIAGLGGAAILRMRRAS